MKIEELIYRRVNSSRGGYEPAEVEKLMLEAFELGRSTSHREAADAHTELVERQPGELG